MKKVRIIEFFIWNIKIYLEQWQIRIKVLQLCTVRSYTCSALDSFSLLDFMLRMILSLLSVIILHILYNNERNVLHVYCQQTHQSIKQIFLRHTSTKLCLKYCIAQCTYCTQCPGMRRTARLHRAGHICTVYCTLALLCLYIMIGILPQYNHRKDQQYCICTS